MRQLTTFLAKIEKWHKYSEHQQTVPIKPRGRESPQLKEPRKEQAPRKRSTNYDDPEWILRSGPPPRKTQRHYGGKQHKDNSESRKLLGKLARLPKTPKASNGRLGEIDIDTPLIVGTFPVAGYEEVAEEPRKGRLGRSGTYRQKIVAGPNSDGDYNTLAQGLLNIVQVFLDTTKDEEVHQHGARLLLTLCQRRIPDCILEEQKACDAQKEEEGDVLVASRLFAELEDVYSNGIGWKPLRGIVRSHGIKLLCQAIEREYLTADTAASLARQSADLGHFDAYELFSKSLFYTAVLDRRIQDTCAAFPNPDQAIKDWLRSDNLYTQCEAEIITTFKLCVIQDALKKDQSHLFLLHLLSFDTTLVRSSISSLTGGGATTAAGASLLHTFLLRTLDISRSDLSVRSLKVSNSSGNGSLSEELDLQETSATTETSNFASRSIGEHSRSVNATIRSILTLITSTGLIRQRKKSVDDYVLHMTLHLVDNILIQVLRQRELSAGPSPSPSNNFNMFYFLILHILLSNGDNQRMSIDTIASFEQDVRHMSWKSEIVTRGASFLLDATYCCGRAERDDGFSALKHVIDEFSLLESSNSPTLSKIMQHIAVTAAISFAQRYDRPSYYGWAAEVQRRFSAWNRKQGLQELETPTLAHNWTTYLWDDSIEEWIAETPLVKHDAPAPQQQITQSLDTPAAKGEVNHQLNYIDKQVPETPTPDLLALPSPPTTSSPLKDSPVAVKLRRKSDGPTHRDDRIRASRVVKRNRSYEDVAELPDMTRVNPSKRPRQGLRRQVRIHVDEDHDELAPTPKAQTTKCRPNLRINGRCGNRRQMAIVGKVVEGTQSESEDEFGVL